jgi:malonyl-ACP O-methyltransferase BioC
MSFDKKIIDYNFSSKVNEYNLKANIQKKVAKKLCKIFIENSAGKTPNKIKILDLGSGTSFVSRNLLKNIDNCEIYELDLSLKMLNNYQKNSKKISKICGDIENLPFVESSFDVIISSFSLQWLENFDNLFSNLYKILKPRGILAFSIPDNKSFEELKDSPFSINKMPDNQELANILLKNQFTKKTLINEKNYEKFSNLIEILKSFKKIGVNYSLTNNNKKNFKDLKKFYLKNFQNNLKCKKLSWSISYFIYYKND